MECKFERTGKGFIDIQECTLPETNEGLSDHSKFNELDRKKYMSSLITTAGTENYGASKKLTLGGNPSTLNYESMKTF